jgi:hypothetical protein
VRLYCRAGMPNLPYAHNYGCPGPPGAREKVAKGTEGRSRRGECRPRSCAGGAQREGSASFLISVPGRLPVLLRFLRSFCDNSSRPVGDEKGSPGADPKRPRCRNVCVVELSRFSHLLARRATIPLDQLPGWAIFRILRAFFTPERETVDGMAVCLARAGDCHQEFLRGIGLGNHNEGGPPTLPPFATRQLARSHYHGKTLVGPTPSPRAVGCAGSHALARLAAGTAFHVKGGIGARCAEDGGAGSACSACSPDACDARAGASGRRGRSATTR